MSKLKSETRQKLMCVSTATISTALFKRGFRNQMIQDVRPLNASLPNMVGEAFTLRYIPAREDLNPITVFNDRNHPQRKAIEMTAYEDFVTQKVREGRSIVGLCPATHPHSKVEFEAWRKANKW